MSWWSLTDEGSLDAYLAAAFKISCLARYIDSSGLFVVFNPVFYRHRYYFSKPSSRTKMVPSQLVAGAQIFALGFTVIILWRRFFSPLKTIPGPPLASLSRFWHLYHIIKGDQNLQLVNLHDKYDHFVRIAHNEVSVSHPDVIKKILITPLHKASWYKFLFIPDYRYQTPMSTTDPKKKVERSRHLTAGYTMSNVRHRYRPACNLA